MIYINDESDHTRDLLSKCNLICTWVTVAVTKNRVGVVHLDKKHKLDESVHCLLRQNFGEDVVSVGEIHASPSVFENQFARFKVPVKWNCSQQKKYFDNDVKHLTDRGVQRDILPFDQAIEKSKAMSQKSGSAKCKEFPHGAQRNTFSACDGGKVANRVHLCIPIDAICLKSKHSPTFASWRKPSITTHW